MNREVIYSALFDRLKVAANFRTASRRLKHWTDVSPADQPALFVAQKGEAASTVPGQPTVWTMSVDVYVYVNTAGDQSAPPAQVINPLVDSLLACLAPDVITNKCTLSGLVQHAWVEGQIQTDEGWLGDQAVCIIPVVMKVV